MTENPKSSDPKPIRCFVCLEIPAAIQNRIGALQTSLKLAETGISWVKPANIHLTLKFLGNVAANRIESLCESIRRASTMAHPFELEVGGAGCFPTPRNPRVLWVGVSSVPEQLSALYGTLEDELAVQDFDKEKRPFAPHLTIARIKTPSSSHAIAERLIAAGFASESVPVRELVLMQSNLSPTGAIYTPLYRAPFPADD